MLIKLSKKILFSIIFLKLLFIHSLKAQHVEHSFGRISTEEGLTSNRINAIVQDKTGLLWIATNNGLNRYDGAEIKRYIKIPEDSSSLSGNVVLALFCDNENQLWILTINYLHKYDRDLDNFKRYQISNTKESYRYENKGIITKDADGNLWISSPSNGLFLLRKGASQCERVLPYITEASSLYFADAGNVWIGKKNGEILRYNSTTGAVKAFQVTSKKSRIINYDYVWHIWPENDSVLNLMLSTGFYRLNTKDGKIVPNSNWNDLTKSSETELRYSYLDGKNLWVGTEGKGLYIINTRENSVENYRNEYNKKNSLSNNSITAIIKDLSGVYWVATKDGLNKYDPVTELFTHYQNEPGNPGSLHYNFVSSFCQAPNGKIWVGTFGQGIAVFDRDNDQFSSIKSSPESNQGLVNNSVRAMEPDSEGNIWIGTINGLSCYQTRTNKFITYKASEGDRYLPSNDILSLLAAKDNTLWIGTNGKGVSRVNLKNITTDGFKTYSSKNGFLKADKIRKIIELQNGTICLGTLGGGVDLMLNEKVVNVSPSSYSKSIESDYVNALCEDRDGQLWIGTWDGLFLLDAQHNIQQQFGNANRLASGDISGIILDDRGDLWVSSMNGISHLAKNNKAGYDITNYSTSNGLQGSYFTAYSTLKSSDGEIYFGGFNGFNRFYPTKIVTNRTTPKVIFTDLQVFNQTVPINGEVLGRVILTKSITNTNSITLNYKHKVVSFHFAALTTSQVEKVRYACFMKGIDPDWVYLDKNQRSISYNNLPPGDYQLLVKASNADNIWSTEVSAINIKVLPPFWKTGLAYLIYILTIGGLFYLARKYRTGHVKLEKKALVEQVLRKKDAEINSMRVNFFTNISHEIRTPLSLILAPLEKLMQLPVHSKETKKDLELINNNAIRLLHLVNQLLDFRKIDSGNIRLHVAPYNLTEYLKEIKEAFDATAAKKNITFTLTAADEKTVIFLDAGSFEKIMFNLLSNAFKFTPPNGKVEIIVNQLINSSECEIIVRDNGIGIPDDKISKLFDPFYQVDNSNFLAQNTPGYGIGLAIVKSLVTLHKGEISVASLVNEYTEFRIILKTGKTHFEQNKEVSISNKPLLYTLTSPTYYNDTEDDKIAEFQQPENFSNIPKDLKILLVEDNQDIRNYIKSLLLHSFEVIEANNGKTGCEIAIQEVPDLIISDVMMPQMNGIELCNILKNNLLTQHIPIILLTAKSTLQDELEGLETGADAYVAKPFSMQLLLAKIKSLIYNRQKLTEKYSHQNNVNEAAPVTEAIVENYDFGDPFVSKVIDFIKENLQDEALTNEKIEHHFNTSKMQLYRKLKAVCGISVNTLIKEIRIQEAKKLLQNDELNISQIAYSLGFSDPLYFSKFFKKSVGLSPQQFRKSKDSPPLQAEET